MRTSIILAAAAAILSVAAFAHGHDGGHDGKRHHGDRGHHMVEKLDANKDGNITRAEVQAAHAARFAAVDANKDGAVTREEMQAHHQAKIAERQTKRAERHAEHFARMDKNSDGRLTADEFGGDRRGNMFERLDTNNDGTISADERAAAKAKRQDKRKG